MLQWPRKVPDLACDESLFDKGSSNTITSALMRLFRLPRRRVLWFGASLAFLFLLYTLFLRVRPPHKHPGQHYYPQNDLYRESDVAVKLKSSHKQAEYIDKKGVHVVVGRYVGDSLHRDVPKFGDIELNLLRHTAVSAEAGKLGEPVYLPSSEDKRAKRLWHINKFNIVVSDKIPLNRSLPDVRKPNCQSKEYDSDLPHASVIIVFHNEAWSTLLRTVQSVIDRSPKAALKEIILVDDASNRTFLGNPLEDYIRGLPVPMQLIRTHERVGLIKARMVGAKRSSGKVLVFLDAHCETTDGWLEPLLARIKEKRTAVVCPVIDIINDDNFSYVKSFSLHWGAFNWELHFRWFTMSKSVLEDYKSDWTLPYRTPVMAGGLFAMDRAYFYELGTYDEEMDIWGGENLELSFRVWMCGGSVEIAPCSHVGHVFRKASPYTFPREGGVGAVLHQNLARVALVWMDEMKDFYFKTNPHAKKAAIGQNVDKRLALRQALQCKSFDWYLENVWPEHFLPGKDRPLGKFRHRQTGLCVQKPFRTTATSNQPSGAAILDRCQDKDFYVPQLVVLTSDGFIMADESVCLDSPIAHEDEATVRYQACSEIDRQKWVVQKSRNLVVHKETGKCLSHPTAGTSDILTLQVCNGKTEQQWVFEEEVWS